MTENPPAAPAAPAPEAKPNWLWAVLAAMCPLAACPVTPAVATASSGSAHEPARLFMEGGALAYATLAVFVFGAVAIAVLAAVTARGIKAPATVMMLLAALPWLTGIAGMRLGLSQVQRAIDNVNPADKATILAAGIAEASACRLLGTFLTSGLCAATALALGLAAVGNAKKPAPAGLLAVLAAAPLFIACLVVPNFREVGPVGFLVLLPASAFVLAAGMAGLGAASGTPRSALLAAVLGIPAMLAVSALARGVGVSGMIRIFQAIAMVSPEDKGTIAAAGAMELASADKLAMVSLIAGGLGALALAAFAALKTENKTPLIIELVLCAGIAVLAVEADGSAVNAAAAAMNSTDKLPWAAVSGFQPLQAKGGSIPDEAWVLTQERLTGPNGEAIDAPFSEASQQKLEDKLASSADKRAQLGYGTPGWTVAVDRRVQLADFAKLVEVARRAGLGRVSVVGKGAELPAAGGATWWVGLLGSTGSVDFALKPTPDYLGEVKPPKETTAVEIESGNVDSRFQPALEPKGMELQQLLDLAERLRRDRRGSLLLVGPDGLEAMEDDDAPPDAEPDEDDAEGDEDIDPKVRAKLQKLFGKDSSALNERLAKELGSTGGIGKIEPAPGVGGSGTVGGFKQGIADGVHRHLSEFKYCYEAQLTKKPDLAGKVVLQFTIGTAGTVTAAKVSSSTAHDAALENCLVTRMKKVTFGVKPKTPTDVSYPFIFNSAK